MREYEKIDTKAHLENAIIAYSRDGKAIFGERLQRWVFDLLFEAIQRKKEEDDMREWNAIE